MKNKKQWKPGNEAVFSLCHHRVLSMFCWVRYETLQTEPILPSVVHQWLIECFSYKTTKKTSRCTCDVSKTDVSGFLPACNDHHFARVTVKNLCCTCVPYLHKHDIILNNSNNTKNRNNVRYSTAHSFHFSNC